MKIDEVYLGQEVYHPATSKRVKVYGIDYKSEYIYIKDSEGNVTEVHVSRLQEITSNDEWDVDDILRREG